MISGWPGPLEALALAALAAIAARAVAGRRGVTLCNEARLGPGLAAVEAALERAGVDHYRLGGRLVSPQGPVEMVAEEAPGGLRVRVELKAWFAAFLLTLALLEPPLALAAGAYAAYSAYRARSIAHAATRPL